MVRNTLVCAAVLLALAGCSSGHEDRAQPTPTTSSAAASTTAAKLGTVDAHTCRLLIADAGDAYGWLTTLERDGEISGDLGTPGYLEVYQLGGSAQAFSGHEETPALRDAVQRIEDEGLALRKAIDGQGSVKPTPLREALEDAAAVCDKGGVRVGWFTG